MTTSNSKDTQTDAPETAAETAGETTTAKAPKTDPAKLVERAVLMQVGAGLVVRDDIVASLRKMSKKYGTAAGREKELTRYEKRGARARKGLERQVKRQRTQFERDIRARRRRVEDHASAIGKRFEAPAERARTQFERPAQAVNSTAHGVSTKIEELISSAHGLIS